MAQWLSGDASLSGGIKCVGSVAQWLSGNASLSGGMICVGSVAQWLSGDTSPSGGSSGSTPRACTRSVMGNHNLTDSGRWLSTSYRAGVQWVCGTYLLLCLIKKSCTGTPKKHPSYEGLLPKSPLD